MTSIVISGKEADIIESALYDDVSDPVEAMRAAGANVATFFEDGVWKGADFRRSNLEGISFRRADLRGALLTTEQVAVVARSEPRYLPEVATPLDKMQTRPAAENSVGTQQPGRMPSNIEAEQHILAAVLRDNDAYDRIASILRPEHFFDPVHARIFEVAAARIQKNAIASVLTIKPFFEGDPALTDLGGVNYLRRLEQLEVSQEEVRDLASNVYDLAVRRALIIHANAVKDLAENLTEGKDSFEQISIAEQGLHRIRTQRFEDTGFVSFLRSVTDAVNQANSAYQRGSGLSGISSGFRCIDEFLGGLIGGSITIIAGRPSMGKSALAVSIALSVARKHRLGTLPDGSTGAIEGGSVGYFALEKSAEQIATQILCIMSQVESHKIRAGNMSEAEFRGFVEAAKSLESMPLYIDDTPSLHVSELTGRVRRLKRTHGIDLLIVDPLQQTRDRTDGELDVQRDFSLILRDLKVTARELNIPIIVISQLSSNVDERLGARPKLSDLREFGVLERYADAVLFLTRAEYYHELQRPEEYDPSFDAWKRRQEALRGKAELIVAKNSRGPVGTSELKFDSRFAVFLDDSYPLQFGFSEREQQPLSWDARTSSEEKWDRSGPLTLEDDIPF